LTTKLSVDAVAHQCLECTVPVIVLGGGITAAAVLTLLAQAEVPSYTIAPRGDFVARSRWHRDLPVSRVEPAIDNLPEFLEQLPLERAVLMPCSDDWALAVAALPGRLLARFPSSSPSADTLNILVDKWRLAEVLKREGIAHPRTRLIRSFQELSNVNSDEFRGAILKPLSSVEFAYKYGVKGFVVENQDEALIAMGRAEFPIMLQEFIPGPPSAGYFLDGFVDKRGKVCGLLARQRLRMSPPKLGNSTLMVTVEQSEVSPAADALKRLLGLLKYRGTFSAEFKRDERDGNFKLFEINARPWWYVEFASRCGVDVCSMAYRDALGYPVEAVGKYEIGRRCVFFVHDLRAWKEQQLPRASLWSWIRPWFGADATPFHWNDPAPAIAYARKLIRDNKTKRVREKNNEEMQRHATPVPAKFKTIS
jgi:D-aspartate ligase